MVGDASSSSSIFFFLSLHTCLIFFFFYPWTNRASLGNSAACNFPVCSTNFRINSFSRTLTSSSSLLYIYTHKLYLYMYIYEPPIRVLGLTDAYCPYKKAYTTLTLVNFSDVCFDSSSFFFIYFLTCTSSCFHSSYKSTLSFFFYFGEEIMIK